jgi:serine/threonine-protein kinase
MGIKIIDFNRSAVKNEDGTYTLGLKVGSRFIIPPELVTEVSHPTVQSDIYQLGILYYNLLTGKFPYEFEEYSEPERTEKYYEAHRNGQYSMPESLSPKLQNILQRAIQPDQNKRYESTNEMLKDLLGAFEDLI